MEFLEWHYEDILLDYRFIRASGVQLNLKSEKDVIQLGSLDGSNKAVV